MVDIAIRPDVMGVIIIGLMIALGVMAYEIRQVGPFYRPGCRECTDEARRVMDARKQQEKNLAHEYEHRWGDCSDGRCPRNKRNRW